MRLRGDCILRRRTDGPSYCVRVCASSSNSLDFNLHQAILSSLAASFSREDNKNKDIDKGKHTEIQHSNDDDGTDAAATAAAPQSSAGQENALSRFGFNAELLSSNGSGSGSSSRNARLWRLSDANALIAVCEYLRAAIVPDAQAERIVLAALEQLGDIRIERCLGAQGQFGYAPASPKKQLCTG